jgi:hypothetical protein
MIADFQSFLQVERQLSKRTVYSHCSYLGKLIKQNRGGDVGPEEIRGFMRGHMGASVSGYSNALKALRIFFRDYIGRGDLVEGFKFPATPFKPRIVPTPLRAKASPVSPLIDHSSLLYSITMLMHQLYSSKAE